MSMRRKKRSGYRRVTYTEQIWYLIKFKLREIFGRI